MFKRIGAMGRRRWYAVVLGGVLLGLGAALWVVLDTGPLRRIVVTSSTDVPSATQPFWQITIDDHDHYSFSTYALKRQGTIPFGPFAQRFRAIPETRWLLPPDRGGLPGIYFWAEGSRRTSAPFVGAESSSHAELRAFAVALHDAVVADMRRVDAPRTAALDSLTGLQSLELEATGAMCGACWWTLRIGANGRANLTTYQPIKAVSHDALLRWDDVIAIARAAHVGELDARYSTSGSDFWGVRFRFAFSHRSYDLDAPDLSTLPRQLRRPFVRLVDLIDRARWSPPLDAKSFPRADGMRIWADAGA